VTDFFQARDRIRDLYVPKAPEREVAKTRVHKIGDGGFMTEVAGRVILTAPATRVTLAEDLPAELASNWSEKASGNRHMMWLQGRYVEAEAPNRNGALWETADLQFGEMSVKHGPLNWLHDEQTVVGTIADNALIMPKAPSEGAAAGSEAMPRPYMAAVSAVWKWVHPEKSALIEAAAETKKLWYSMECIARQMSCVETSSTAGCGKSFDYVQAMTRPETTCEHIQARSSARRMVDPCFLGGAVIIPPTQPGWARADVEVVRQSAALAEQAYRPSLAMSDEEWTSLMASVVSFATA
jgi:hypothetical protein